MEAEKRLYKQLLDQMELADNRYWVENNPIMSDDEYDDLIRNIQQLEETYPDIIDTSRSPTYHFDGKSMSESVVHTKRMYSLDKGYDQSKLQKWYDRVTKMFPLASFYIDPKMDGVALDIWYRDYKLCKILTRGTNGIAGEDITHQAPLFHTLPKVLPPYPYLKDVDIRGEAVIYDTTFQHHIQETYPNTYSNSRSAVGGLLQSKTVPVKSLKKLSFKAYGVVFHTNHPFTTHKEVQLFLRDNCRIIVPSPMCELLPANEHTSVPFSDIWERIQDIEHHRERIMCAADGVVVRLNTFTDYEYFGHTEHHPIGAFAYKFAPEGANTILTNIAYQITKSGKLSPIGVLEPVVINGVTITNVNLHNESHIEKLGLELGDTVHVVRQGDSVPMIKSVIVERRAFLRTRKHIPPTVCICCGYPLMRPPQRDHVYCTNPDCPAILLENICYFTSKHGINVKGIGAAVWKRLIEKKRIRTIEDLFTLTVLDFQYIVGEEAALTDSGVRYSDKTCEKMFNSLQYAWKKITLANCIAGLGISRIGRGVSLQLGKLYNTHTEFLIALDTDNKPDKISLSEWQTLKKVFANANLVSLLCRIFDNKPI